MGNEETRTSPCKVLGIIFLIILILSAAFVALVHIAFKNENVTPSIGGYSLYLIHDDYMSPKIKKNSLIFATNGKPLQEDIGKVVIADDVSGKNGITYGTTAMRFVDLVNEDNQLFYELKFDNSKDSTMVKGNKIVGIANYQFELIGKIIVLANSTLGYIIFIGIPAILMIIFLALGKHSKTKQLAAIEIRREKLQVESENTEEDSKSSFDDFVNEREKLQNTHQESVSDQFSDVKGSEILNEPLIEEGVNKDDLVEMKQDLTKPTNSAIEELMKILEEENAKLKELELPKAEKAVQEAKDKYEKTADTVSDTEAPEGESKQYYILIRILTAHIDCSYGQSFYFVG